MAHRFGRRPGNTRRGNYWEVFSPKIQRRVQLYSTSEYHHWISVEADPQIVDFETQPGLFEIGLGEERLRTFPDMLVTYRDGRRELREIKTVEDILKASARVLRQIAALKACSAAHGVGHRVVSSDHLLQQRVLIENWRMGVALINDVETDTQQSKRILMHTAMDENAYGYLVSQHGKDAARGAFGQGHKTNDLPAVHPYQRGMLDGHRVDALFTLEFQNPRGEIEFRLVERPWLLLIIDAYSRAVLAWCLILEREYSQDDVLYCIRRLITPWKSRDLTIPGLKRHPEFR